MRVSYQLDTQSDLFCEDGKVIGFLPLTCARPNYKSLCYKSLHINEVSGYWTQAFLPTHEIITAG